MSPLLGIFSSPKAKVLVGQQSSGGAGHASPLDHLVHLVYAHSHGVYPKEVVQYKIIQAVAESVLLTFMSTAKF